jgi:excisionase family DNA binding protein
MRPLGFSRRGSRLIILAVATRIRPGLYAVDPPAVMTGPHIGANDGPRLAYTVTQAARALGLSKSMIYDQLRSRRLGSVKVGSRRIIARQQIDAWLAGLPGEPPEP